MIDCVGFMVPSALGQFENEMPRMVTTPWFEHEIPMTEAAEIGTKKVITDHATIGIMVTTDGSIAEIPREEYAAAEERVVNELNSCKKPYIILVNSKNPDAKETVALANELSEKFKVAALPVDVMNMEQDKIMDILSAVLYEFPIRLLDVYMPRWFDSLPSEHWLKNSVYGSLAAAADNLQRIKDIKGVAETLSQNEIVSACKITDIRLGNGSADLKVEIGKEVFYRIINEETGFEISDEASLLPLLTELSGVKKSWARVATALEEVDRKGYGIVVPDINELKLEQPTLVRQGNRFGVKLRASAPSIHMMRADIMTTVSPVVGSEQQSEELVNYLLKEFEGNEEKLWESKIFGKSLHELVNEGLASKLNHMPEEARGKFRETLERLINEGSQGLICIII
jgi:stage IV sporulation protein A